MRFRNKIFLLSVVLVLLLIDLIIQHRKHSKDEVQEKINFEGFDNNTGAEHPIVPNIIHFIQFDKKTISFIHFICICSALYNHGDATVMFHTNIPDMQGKYFNILRDKFAGVFTVQHEDRPSHVYGQKLSSVEHAADVARVKILMKYGGIMLDMDVFVVRNLNKFRHFELAIGWPEGQNIGSQIIIAHKDARFLPQYLALYQEYRPNMWYYNAGEAPTNILVSQPGLVTRCRTEFGVENLATQLYTGHWPGWSQRYTIHLLDSHKHYLTNTSDITEENYRDCDCTMIDMIQSIVSSLEFDKIYVGKTETENEMSVSEEQVIEFISGESKSLLHTYLTKEVYERIKHLKSPATGTVLQDVIRSGLAHPDSALGVYAPDAESYTVFGDLLLPIIRDYHKISTENIQHPASDWNDETNRIGVFQGDYVKSTRIRIARNLRGYPLNSKMSKNDYLRLEREVRPVLETLTGELSGSYVSLLEMTPVDQEKLISEHLMFGECDQYLTDAGACQHWPHGRGIFINHDKTFVVWVGEEDHFRIISIQHGGDLGAVFHRLSQAVHILESKLDFMRSDSLGYLTFCPSNLGTTLRASVHIDLPRYFSKSATTIQQEVGQLGLQVRGAAGEHTDTGTGVRDLSNIRRLGHTEVDIVTGVFEAVNKLIELEQKDF